MNPDRKKLIRLAYSRPELRKSLLPLLKEAAGMKVTLDVTDTTEAGGVFVVRDSGVRSDHGGKAEWLHEITSTDGVAEGHVIAPTQLRSGMKLVVEALFDRPRGRDYAGEAKVRTR